MAIFGKKEKEREKPMASDMPKLPDLPKLPGLSTPPSISQNDSQTIEFPTIDSVQKQKEQIHQLPSFPNNEMGDRFSQDTIKNAVKGREEDLPPMKDLGNYKIDEKPMETNSEPERRIIPTEKAEMPIIERTPRVQQEEPVFIRIDKFEDSLKLFDRVKNKLSDIETLLEQTKDLKNKEKVELDAWEEEIQKLKSQIEKIDGDIFSQLE